MLQRKELHVARRSPCPDERLKESRYSDTVCYRGRRRPRAAGRARRSSARAATASPSRCTADGSAPAGALRRICARSRPARSSSSRPTVLVRGPQEVLDRARCIPTRPSELPARPMHAPANVAAIGRVALVRGAGRPAGPRHAAAGDGARARTAAQGVRADRRAGPFPCPANFTCGRSSSTTAPAR